MEKVKIKLLKVDDAQLPEYMTAGAAGMDIHTCMETDIILKPFERALIPTGLRMEIPEGYEVQLRPRSGLALKHGITLLNTPGTIDSDFRGEIKLIVANLSHHDFIISPGDRIAQMVVNKVTRAELKIVEVIEDTDRGEGGFGHTGKN